MPDRPAEFTVVRHLLHQPVLEAVERQRLPTVFWCGGSAEALRARTDAIVECLDAKLAQELTPVQAAADAGVTSMTTDADVIRADDGALTTAYRNLPAAVTQLDALTALVDDLRELARVPVPPQDWPPHNRGLVLAEQADGGHRWEPDQRTGKRWLSWVLGQRTPPEPDNSDVVAA